MTSTLYPVTIPARALKGVLVDNVIHLLESYREEALIATLLEEMELLTFDKELGRDDLIKLRTYREAIVEARSAASAHTVRILQILKDDVDNVIRAIGRT